MPVAQVTGLLLLRARDGGAGWHKRLAMLYAVRVLLWRMRKLHCVKLVLSVCHVGTSVN